MRWDDRVMNVETISPVHTGTPIVEPPLIRPGGLPVVDDGA